MRRRLKALLPCVGLAVWTIGCLQSAVSAQRLSGRSDAGNSREQLPDWHGVWMRSRTPPAATSRPTDPSAAIAARATGGDTVSFTPQYARLATEAAAVRAQQNMSYCLPAGVPGILHHTVLFEYLLTPGQVTMLFEDGEVRRIYTDGRKHRPLQELSGSYMGDSVGHWEGGTLVVDTIGFPKGSLFENYGVVATLHSHLAERIFLEDGDLMEIDSVLTDPAIFTEPYVFSRLFKRASLPIGEPTCAEHNRDTGDSIDLTPPPEG